MTFTDKLENAHEMYEIWYINKSIISITWLTPS